MGFIALSLFILACGWKVYRDYIPTRAKANRSQGHPQYFGAALAAGLVFLLAASIHVAAKRVPGYTQAMQSVGERLPRSDEAKLKMPASPPQFVINPAPVVVNSSGAASSIQLRDSYPIAAVLQAGRAPDARRTDDFLEAFAIAGWSSILSLTLPFLLNIPYRANRHLRSMVIEKDLEEIERVLSLAFKEGMAVAVTMVSQKTYIGVPLVTGQDGVSETQWIQIQPLASGFRDDRGQLTLTTAYDSVYEDISGDDEGDVVPEDFKVVLPIDKIVTVQHFDLDVYLDRFSLSEDLVPRRAPIDESTIPNLIVVPEFRCAKRSATEGEGAETSLSDAEKIQADEAPQEAKKPVVVRLHALRFLYFLGLLVALVGTAKSFIWLVVLMLPVTSALMLAFAPTGSFSAFNWRSGEDWGYVRKVVRLRLFG